MHPADGCVVVVSSKHQIDEDLASIAEEIRDLLTRRGKTPRLASTLTETTRINLARLPKIGEYLLGLETSLPGPTTPASTC